MRQAFEIVAAFQHRDHAALARCLSAISISLLVAQAKSLSTRLQVGERIARVRVEAGRDDDEIGPEVREPRQDRAVERLAELLAAVAGRKRRVDDGVVLAALGLARRCRDRAASGGSSNTSRSDRTRKCPACRCRDARRNRSIATRLEAVLLLRVARGDRGVVEQAEAHRPRRLGVMAGRAHGDEGVVGLSGHTSSTA